MKFNDIVNIIEEIAPVDPSIEWDNSGVQIDAGSPDIDRILVCLEINMDVIEEAKAKKAGMILTHHPLVFHKLKTIRYGDYPGKYIQECIRSGISVYSAHLSFDFAEKGNNYYIAQLLGLIVKNMGSMADGYYGLLPEPMSLEQACSHVEKALDLPFHYIRCVDGGRRQLTGVGWCTGAGGDYIFDAARRGCDLFITGDVKLHEAQYAKAMGMSVIDAGHYGTEKIFTENMACLLRGMADEKRLHIEVLMSEANANPYTI